MNKVFDKILSYEGSNNGKRYLVSPRTVSEFFTEGNYILKIPDYQRPYSWTDKNIKDLLEDISRLSKKEDSSWFLGPIFTVRRSSETKYSELLDGQQRITTIQIILREATLLRFHWSDFDFASHHEIKRNLDTIKEICNRCLVKLDGLTSKPVFETEPDMKAHFSNYIVNFQNIDTLAELESIRLKFEEDTLKAQEQGSVTAKTILSSIETIKTYLEDNFVKNDQKTSTNIESFIKFIESLVTKCWLIEIPLQSHDDSIQIFESLNNRGKKLTLVDKLRFKSIIKSSSDTIDQVRQKWKYIYAGISFLIENGYVKSEDDFYKVFFNSVNGDNYTREDDFITLFTNKYLQNDTTILSFLEETLKIIGFHKILHYSLNEGDEFINSFDKKEQEKVKALFQLLKSTLDVSDNSRLLLFSVIRKNHQLIEEKYIIIQSIWSIIRIVFHTEIYKNKKSNIIRGEYMELVKEFTNDNPNVFLQKNPLTFSRSIIDLIKTKNNTEAKLVLVLYTYLYDFKALCSHSPKQYTNWHLDHLFPSKWLQNWSQHMYRKDDVIKYIDALQQTQQTNLAHINWEQIKIDINSLDSAFELDKLKQTQTEDTLIEFIGNKWLLHSGSNIKTSNKEFSFKKEEYLEQKWIKIPSNSNALGIDKYNEFTYKEIVLRSLQLADSIIEKFNNTWDDI